MAPENYRETATDCFAMLAMTVRGLKLEIEPKRPFNRKFLRIGRVEVIAAP